MRVSSQSIFTQVMDGLQQAFQRVAKTQEVVTTGKRINRASDDPIGAVRVSGLRNIEASLSQYEKNLSSLLPPLEQADSVLGQVTEHLMRAKELALAMANDVNSAEQRSQTAKEVRQLFEQVLSSANTRVEDRYIFGGFRNATAPFARVGGVVTYSGDSGQILIQTTQSSSIAVNIPGDQVFQGVGVVGGVDIFDILLDLETALLNNDVTGPNGIQTQIGRLNTALGQLPGFRAEIGARLNSAQTAADALAVMKIRTTGQRSQLEDADVLAVYSDFARYQQAFQAALQSAAQVIRPSLLDFIR